MGEQALATDPYEAVISDLRSKRDQIEQTIALLTALRGGGSADTPASATSPPPSVPPASGIFHGMSIVDGTRKLLATVKRPMGNVDIAHELQAGGIVLSSEQPSNVVGSVLTRRFQQVGDVVKVGRGIWGLKEWYGEITSPSDLKPSPSLQINDLSSTGAPIRDDFDV